MWSLLIFARGGDKSTEGDIATTKNCIPFIVLIAEGFGLLKGVAGTWVIGGGAEATPRA